MTLTRQQIAAMGEEQAILTQFREELGVKLLEFEETLEKRLQERCDECRDQAKADLNVANKFHNDRLSKVENTLEKQILETRNLLEQKENELKTQSISKREIEVLREEFEGLIKAQDDSIDEVLTTHDNEIKTLKERARAQALRIQKLEEIVDRRMFRGNHSG